ncbi:MAG: 5'-nucleotidase C-terminal domain-containing protein [Solobacterium sp.]|nr:5'-nucleotidase C-terminal domain-containing protein [Solobacterium sp.]
MSEKKLVLLHSNDMHGHFVPEIIDDQMTGGLPVLAGYLKKTRKKEKNVIYAIAGDMFRGSIIDSEYLGLSTIDLVNLLDPDVAALGNHEVDYGVAHLLFLEKCARFPLINANLFVTLNNARLFQPYVNVEVGGMRVMFIGILTEEVLSMTKNEKVIGSFIDIEEAAKEVGVICDNYRTTSTDMTVLLTHVGIEEDRKLAELLKPEYGVDIIIGAHTHTFMDQPEYVNGIPIVQAGWANLGLGRFDISYDDEAHRITDLQWKYIPIRKGLARPDPVMKDLLNRYKNETDNKYKRIVTRFARKLTHPSRIQETEMGNLYADILQVDSSFDIMLFGSGSIRKTEMGPIVEYQDMLENTPYDDALWMVKVTGKQFRQIVRHLFRDEAWLGHTEFYQFSKGVRLLYRKSMHELLECRYQGREIEDDQELLIALQNYHYQSFTEFLGVDIEEVKKNMKPRIVATTVNNIIEEYLSVNQGLDAHVEGRIEILE